MVLDPLTFSGRFAAVLLRLASRLVHKWNLEVRKLNMPAFSEGPILDSRKFVKQHSLVSSLDSEEEEFVETNGSECSDESAS